MKEPGELQVPAVEVPSLGMLVTPSIVRRAASLAYETVLLIAIAFVATSVFMFASGGEHAEGRQRLLLQLYLGMVFAAYFLWCWLRGGQTLAMKAWRIKLILSDGGRVPPSRALLRFVLFALIAACYGASVGLARGQSDLWLVIGMLALGSVSTGWAIFDRDGQFLHDRLSGTRLVMVPRPASSPG